MQFGDMAAAQVPVRIVRPAGVDDVLVEINDPEAPIEAVFAALGLDRVARSDGEDMDRRPDHRTPALDVLVPGTVIDARATPQAVRALSASPKGNDFEGDGLAMLSVVAGADAGGRLFLPAGRYRIDELALGSGGDENTRAVDRFYVDIAGTTDDSAISHPVVVSGSDHRVAIELATPIESNGTGFLHRPPRSMPVAGVDPINVATLSSAPREPAPLSWATLLAPIPVALVMAFFFRPLFAIFAAMGPIMALGRWAEDRRRYRRAHRELAAERSRAVLQLEIDRAGQRRQIVAARWAAQPHVSTLLRWAEHRSVRTWERRIGDPDFLHVQIGVGSEMVEARVADDTHDDELASLATAPMVVDEIPIVVPLREHRGLGLCGDRAVALAVARSIVAQLVTLHGPSDVRIALLCDDDRRAEWDWLKWLPHLSDAHVQRDAVDLAERLAGGVDGPVTVILVDRDRADLSPLSSLLDGESPSAHCIVVASQTSRLPAACALSIEFEQGRSTIVGFMAARHPAITATGVQTATAQRWAQALSALRDPELGEPVAAGDGLLTLFDLIGAPEVDAVLDRWSDHATSAVEVLAAVDARGAFSFDLAVDGPHMLVAGTTGSGKSEFLRGLVLSLAAHVSPARVNFVLVDFKGGGAFAVCEGLPHVAGVITDLDGGVVERVVSALRGELVRREHRFRELGHADLDGASAAAVRRGEAPIARLVIVIDEFAALAADHADQLGAIVDLAARGRSLGMHLVLATQRPSGVVDQKIRANTNLRVALRVQDSFDSVDVVGVGDAAQIDRRQPGQALVRVGGDPPVRVQTAWPGADIGPDRVVSTRPFVLGEAATARSRPHRGDLTQPERLSQAERVVDVIQQAARRIGIEARPLWAPPLPEHLDWIDLEMVLLAADIRSGREALLLGLEDDPDRQQQNPWSWKPIEGALAVVGSAASAAAGVVRAVVTSLAQELAPERVHFFVVDGGADQLAELEALAHVGSVVGVTDTDRVSRLLATVASELSRRRESDFDGEEVPMTMLIVDNVGSLLASVDDRSSAELLAGLTSLARDGAAFGIHVVVTARAPRDIPLRLEQQIAARLILALADPTGYLQLGLRGAPTSNLRPDLLRAIDAATGREVQIADAPPARQIAAAASTGTGLVAEPVGQFPQRLTIAQVPAARRSGNQILVPVGVSASDLTTVELTLTPGEGVVVAGTRGSGRTGVVRLVHRHLSALSPSVPVVVIDGSDGLEPSLVSDLIDDVTPSVVIVDDADLLDAEGDGLLARLVTVSMVTVIVTVTFEGARTLRPWLAPLRSAGQGLVLGGSTADTEPFRVRRPPVEGLGLVAGRGHLIYRGLGVAAQFAQVNSNRDDPSVPNR